MRTTRRVSVYKDRVGNWRWKITAQNGERTGASTEGFAARRIACANLFDVTGIVIVSTRRHGNISKRFRALGERPVTVTGLY